jgi:hypothetical protein
MNMALGKSRILEHVLHGEQAFSEEVHADFLELGSRDGGVEVLFVDQGLALDGGMKGGGEGSLGLLTLGS